MIDIAAVEKEARAEIIKERNDAAKKALVKKLRELELSKCITMNLERELEDIKASLADGSFVR